MVMVPTLKRMVQVTKASPKRPLPSRVRLSLAFSQSPEVLMASSSFSSIPIRVPSTRQITTTRVLLETMTFWMPMVKVISPMTVIRPLLYFSPIRLPKVTPIRPPRIMVNTLMMVAIMGV